MNTDRFLASPQTYFSTAYEQFCAFGGPSVYFHLECLRAGQQAFASQRHLETLYATLTAWGMHRMGDADKMKTKLAGWEQFRRSLEEGAEMVRPFRSMSLTGMSEKEYADAISNLLPAYRSLRLSVSGATIVVNSKALYHLLPNLIPPIDRQYTVRFFKQAPDRWLTANRKFRPVMLPTREEAQFRLFQEICGKVKRLADKVETTLFDQQLRDHDVTPPKAIDNAIVNYVRIVAKATPPFPLAPSEVDGLQS